MSTIDIVFIISLNMVINFRPLHVDLVMFCEFIWYIVHHAFTLFMGLSYVLANVFAGRE